LRVAVEAEHDHVQSLDTGGGLCQSCAMKWIDIPPVWLGLALLVSYWIGQLHLFGISVSHPITEAMSVLTIGVALVLMVLAVVQMYRHKTTVIPHLEADNLVQSGIFGYTRNPIYLGDVVILAGFILRWDAVLALPLVPVLFWVLQTRFILGEEDRLRRKFPQAFESYAATTRRWL